MAMSEPYVMKTCDDSAQYKSVHAPASLLPEPVRQSALKRQSYLYKLVSDADRHRGGHDASATNSDVSSDYKPLPSNSRAAQQQQQRSHDQEYFPPPPTDEELDPSLHQEKAAGINKRAASHAGTLRLYKSPFLPSSPHAGGQQSTSTKSFDYKEFHRSGTVTAPMPSSGWSRGRAGQSDNVAAVPSSGRSASTGAAGGGGSRSVPVSGSQRDSGVGGPTERVGSSSGGGPPVNSSGGQQHASSGSGPTASVGAGSGGALSVSAGSTSGSSGHAAGARPCVVSQRPTPMMSGVKPASHHEPSRHSYVFTPV